MVRQPRRARVLVRRPRALWVEVRDFRPPLVVMSLRKTVSPQEVVPSIFAAVGRLVRVMILAAAGALGFLWFTAPVLDH